MRAPFKTISNYFCFVCVTKETRADISFMNLVGALCVFHTLHMLKKTLQSRGQSQPLKYSKINAVQFGTSQGCGAGSNTNISLRKKQKPGNDHIHSNHEPASDGLSQQ